MSEKISKNWLPIVLIVICVLVILVIAVIAIVGLNDSEDGTTQPSASSVEVSDGQSALTEDGNNNFATLDLNENEVPDLDDEYDSEFVAQ